jgi:hypothetical protein
MSMYETRESNGLGGDLFAGPGTQRGTRTGTQRGEGPAREGHVTGGRGRGSSFYFRYERRLHAGNTVVVVRPRGIGPEKARELLEAHGGTDVRGP